MSQMRIKAVAGLELGDTFTATRTFSAEDVKSFAEISRDYNPVHCDERFCHTKNFDGLICHGLLVASLVTEIGGQIGWLASGMTFQFKKPVYIGETIRCDLTITELDDEGRAKAEAAFINENDVVVLQSVLTGIIPGNRERQVMKDMVTEGDPTNRLNR